MPTLPSILLSNGKFCRLPFIAGTNLDKGTVFTSNGSFDEEVINNLIIANFSPPFKSGTNSDLADTAQRIVEMYPNDPAQGSPFNTGNQTFDLPPQSKRAAAIEGDISFQSQRRLWCQTAAALGVQVFSYLFTQPQTPPSLGVYHGSEVRFVYCTNLYGSNRPRSNGSQVMRYVRPFRQPATNLNGAKIVEDTLNNGQLSSKTYLN
ncbi:Carboxylic ester hydrolase [Mycena venus]|uniref:Carboxylic ester hydrolase n=1 Tax=Mycena venus TaxID=2733690 RepID=A0A8H7CPD6_9AGAR|nr:Carboxylic ester hydrolase [Mycena venus]